MRNKGPAEHELTLVGPGRKGSVSNRVLVFDPSAFGLLINQSCHLVSLHHGCSFTRVA